MQNTKCASLSFEPWQRWHQLPFFDSYSIPAFVNRKAIQHLILTVLLRGCVWLMSLISPTTTLSLSTVHLKSSIIAGHTFGRIGGDLLLFLPILESWQWSLDVDDTHVFPPSSGSVITAAGAIRRPKVEQLARSVFRVHRCRVLAATTGLKRRCWPKIL